MSKIPLRWLIALSFLSIFLGAILVVVHLNYAAVKHVLWINNIRRMESHIRYVVGDLQPTRSLEENRHLVMMMSQEPIVVSGEYEKNVQKLAEELGTDFFEASLLDVQGHVIAHSPDSIPPAQNPPHEIIEHLKDIWVNSNNPDYISKAERFSEFDSEFWTGKQPPPRPPFASQFKIKHKKPSGPRPLRFSYLEGTDRMVLIVPLAKGRDIVGFAQLSSSFGMAKEILNSYEKQIYISALFISAIIILLGTLLAKKLTKPLEHVTNTAEAIGKGNLDARTNLPECKNEIYQVGHQLDIMAEKLQTTFYEQQRFIGDASHELKTPLTSLMGVAHVLGILSSQSQPDPKRDKTLASMDRELSRMEDLVTDLLTLSRNTDPAVNPPSDPINVNHLIQKAIEASLAETMKRELKFTKTGDLWILGDEKALTRALRNLIDNAVKHTPPEKNITISVKQNRKSKSQEPSVVIEVKDEGCGIPPEQLKNIGKRFYRVDSGRSRTQGGTGLGLAIAKAILQRHGGNLVITSVVKEGTSACLVLPVCEEKE